MSKNKNHIDQLTPELIDKYQKGLLSEDEQYQVERLMLNSDFDSEAMEGFAHYDGDMINDLTSLNQQLEQRIVKEKNDSSFFLFKIAASILLLCLCSYLVWDIINNPTEPQIAQNKEIEAAEKPIEAESLAEAEVEVDEDVEIDKKTEKNALIRPSVKTEKSIDLKTDEFMALADTEEEVESLSPKQANEPILEELPSESNFDELISEAEVNDSDISKAISNKVAGVNITSDTAITFDQLANISKKESDGESKSRKKSIARSTTPSMSGVTALDVAKERFNSMVNGKVTSLEDGKPLPGVNVVLKGSTVGTVTDIEGNFQLNNIDSIVDNTLVISFIGLATEEIEIGDRSKVDIQMGNDVAQLSEVVVVGYGSSSTSEVDKSINTWTNSRPSIPMSEFKKYLKDNTRYDESNEVKGKVTVRFDILNNGQLINFEIKRSLNDYYDQEAIRLIKDGPEWLPAEQNGNFVMSSAIVTVRFEKK